MSKVTVSVLRTDEDNDAALERVSDLWGAPEGTPEGDELDVLMTLVESFEDRRHPVDPPDPIEAIRFRMEQMGLERKDLEPDIGSRGRVSEVFSRKRALSVSMIRRLNAHLGVPVDVLIREYELAP